MATANIIDLAELRRSCSQCSLSELCLPAGISVDDLDRLDRLVKQRRPLERGDSLYRDGSSMSGLYVARTGTFKTVAISEDGLEQVLGFHLPGELMGLDGLAEGSHRCSAVALEDALVCEVASSALTDVAAQIPGLQAQLLRVMGRSAARDQDHLQLLARKQPRQRMALFLRSLSDRMQQLGHPADSLNLPMSREELASYLGLVIETVSRTLSRMQDDGIIVVDGRRLTLLDRQRLVELVHESDDRRSALR